MRRGIYKMAKTAKFLDDFKTITTELSNSVTTLGDVAYDFNQFYDSFIFDNLMDASLLKDKMSEAIIKVFNDDIQ